MLIYLEDRKLVKRLLAGDEQAFKQFFEENFGRLYRFALARVSHDEEATKKIVQAALRDHPQRDGGLVTAQSPLT